MAPKRALVATILALCALPSGACFDPTYPIGVACGAGGECPPGQECNLATRTCGHDSGPDDAGVDASPGGPTVELVAPLSALSGCAQLTYRLTSPLEGQRFDVDFEVDRGDGHLVRMSSAASPPGMGGTRGISTGDALTFVWDTTADLRDADASVRIVATPRVVVGPKAGEVGTPGVLEGIPVQNAAGYAIAGGGGFLAGDTVQVGDVDRNGQRDTLIASGNQAVLWNGTSGKNVAFASHVSVALAADFDQDGYPDIAVLREGGFVTVAFNDPSFPSGAFTQKLDLSAGLELHDLITVDVDADGLVDLVASDEVGRVAVLRQVRTPKGTFAAAVTFPAGAAPAGLTAADVDHDGRVDLVVSQSGGGEVVVLHGSAGTPGSFGSPVAIAGLAGDHVATADFDRDGRIDVAALDASSGVLALARQAPAPGSFAIEAAVATGVGPGLLAASVDHDERPDLVTGQAGHLLILHGADLAFRAETIASAPTVLDVAVSDLDRDGQADIVVAGGQTIVFHMARKPGRICDSNLASVVGTSVLAAVVTLESVDLNEDGKLDAVTVTEGGGYVLEGLGDGRMSVVGGDLFVLPTPWGPGARLRDGLGRGGAAVGDLDGDGDLDLALAPIGSEGMSVWLRNPAAPSFGFDFLVVHARPAATDALTIADVDHDGRADLVARAEGRLWVTYQRPGESTSFSTFEALDEAQHLGEFLAAADLDRDGSAEILVEEGDHLLVYRASPGTPATYAAPTTVDAHRLIGKFVLGDVDGDHDLDVLALAPGSGLVVARGDGHGALVFDQQLATGADAADVTDFSRSGDDVFVVETPPAGSRPATTERWHLGGDGALEHVVTDDLPLAGVIASGDYDGDGTTDVILGQPAGSVLVVRRGGAAPLGTLIPRGTVASDRPSLAIGAFDGDHLADLLVAAGNGAARLVHQTAAGGFGAPVVVAGASAMRRVERGDLDRDGLDDLAYLDADGHAFVRRQVRAAPGNFADPVSVAPATLEVHDLGIADLDSDGFDDLVLVGHATAGGSVVWLAGSADGTLGAPTELRPASVGFDRVLIVDINGGGAVGDLVLVRDDGATLESLRQEGTPGVFSPPDVYDADFAGAIREIAFGDLNGDRHGDLLLVRANLLMAQRRGSTTSPGLLLPTIEMDAALGVDVNAVALADVNRDGFVDLAVSTTNPTKRTRIYRQDPGHPGAFLTAIELPGDGQLVTLSPLTPDALPEWIYDDAGGVLRLPLSAPRHPWP